MDEVKNPDPVRTLITSAAMRVAFAREVKTVCLIYLGCDPGYI